MKVCPHCTGVYSDDHTTCPIHGHILNEIIELRPGLTIRGSYRIVSKLGEGGFGTVYLADQTLMHEQRALKFLSRQSAQDEGFTARFRREVRTLHQVRHPNVVDSGDLEQAEDGSLFFAMEYVDGPNLRDLLIQQGRPFDVPMALSIARGIAEGLGAAHAKGMVHRDIKPENILMARKGDVWVPKIADFGIVATKESTTRGTTGGGSLLTWAYAAPEQWRGMRSAELDGRTDLYALGGVLFEMLTGRTVFDAENYEGWFGQHCNATPCAPSSLRREVADWKGLDGLVLRMLAKDRELRHRDTAEMISLLDEVKYLPSQRQETVPEDVEDRREANPAEQHPQPKPTPAPKPVVPEPKASKRVKPFLIALGIVLAIAALAAEGLYFWRTPRELRTLRGHSAWIDSVAFSPDGRALASGSFDHTIRLWDVASGQELRTLNGHTAYVRSVAFSSDGRTLASASDDKTVRLWDVSSGQELHTLYGHTAYVWSVAFSLDGRTLASSSGDYTIRLWDVGSGRELRTLDCGTVLVESVAFSPDGRTLASGGLGNPVRLWDVGSGRELMTYYADHADVVEVTSVAFSPDGRTLAFNGGQNTVSLRDVASGKELRKLQGDTDYVYSVSFSPDGRTLASGGRDKAIWLWDVASGKELRKLQGDTDVYSVVFSPDGRTLAAASADKTIKLWDVGFLHWRWPWRLNSTVSRNTT